MGPGVGEAVPPDPGLGVVGESPTTLLPGAGTTTFAGLAATARLMGAAGTTFLTDTATGVGVGRSAGVGMGVGLGVAAIGVGDKGPGDMPPEVLVLNAAALWYKRTAKANVPHAKAIASTCRFWRLPKSFFECLRPLAMIF